MPDPTVPPSVLGAQITVIGIHGDTLEGLCETGIDALTDAKVIAGGQRHLDAWRSWSAVHPDRPRPPLTSVITIGGDVETAARQIAAGAANGASTVVLASGDPGFFGIVRTLLKVADRRQLVVLPSPSSVSLAFARLAIPWDDAVVVSAHGRPLEDAVRIVRVTRKTAVLTSPDNPPEALGKALRRAGATIDFAAVCSRLGYPDEKITDVDLDTLATGSWDPLSVVVLLGPEGLPVVGWGAGKPVAWGLPESAFEHRSGMITKAELRAVVLGKLALPPAGVLWDVGAGSGSVAVECARLCPGLTVFAVERRPDDVERILANAAAHAVAVHVVEGESPEALNRLPHPDRVFVGGGGTTVLDEIVRRLRPQGRIVATYAALNRAAEAAEILGSLIQVGVSRGDRLPDGGWRLAAENPVFVAWGPTEDSALAGTDAP
jgi:precorrin-6Y C5,15-methyltransferase (decarboxylating)